MNITGHQHLDGFASGQDKEQKNAWHKLCLSLCLMMLFVSGNLYAGEPPVTDKTHFTVAVGQNSHPYEYGTDDGEADGLMVDVWKLWAKTNGYTLDFVLAPWSKSVELLTTGQVDFHVGMAITDKRQKIFLLGQPVVSVRTSFFVHQQVNGIQSIKDLEPYVVGIVAGSAYIPTLTKQYPTIRLKTYASTNLLYQAALDGEVKVFSGLTQVRPTHPDFARLSQMFPLFKKITDKAFDMSFAVNLPNKALFNQITQGFDKIPAGEVAQLEKSWLGGGESDTLVIAMPFDMAPYMSVSANGEPIGLFVDIWRKWAIKARRKIVFLSDNADLSMQNLLDHKADIHAAYADDVVNANLFAHAHHIYSFYSKIYYPVYDDLAGLTEASIDNARLGILSSNPAKEMLTQRFDNVELVFFDDRETMVAASLSHKIDGFVAAQEIINVHLIKRNLQSQFSSLPGIRFESKVYSLVDKENTALISAIKEGFALVPISELAELENAWIEHSESPYFASVKSKVNLSRSEKNWLLRHPVIRLGALTNWAPIEFIDGNGQLIGVTADLKKIIEKRAQITIEVQLFEQWSELLKAFKNKNIDLVANMEQTIERERYTVFSEGYWPSHWALISPSAQGKISAVKDLAGKRLAVVKGYQLIAYLHDHFPKILLQIVPDSQSGFVAVRQGKADAFIDSMVAVANELKEGEYRDMTFSLVEDIDPAMERFGVRDDWQPLVAILNKVIATIDADEKKQILENWFEIKIESGINREKVVQIGGVALVVLILVLIWNRQLQAQVRLRRAMELKMKHMATHDELTGLPNRGLMRDRLDTAIAGHARHKELIAVLFIDLDGFKAVNDTYGHDIGDELLVQIAERFKASVRKSDTVSRCGGDEFVIVLTSLHHREEAVYICEKILNIIQKPFAMSSCTATVGASIGIAIYPDDGIDDEQLLKVSDTLMYEVKDAGKNGYRLSDTQGVGE